MRDLERGDPRTVGRYRIEARIGAGGTAVIYFGRSQGGRSVAVKVMHAECAADPAYQQRFRREVAATRAAGGRYSPGFFDADPDADPPWLAMEYLPGVSLREVVRLLGPLPAGTLWSLAAALAEALASIHHAGLAHLDLNPANVLLTADGPRVIDFGLAVTTRAGPVPLGGTPAGTDGFMAPEQVTGGLVGPASDVHALGATLAYAGTGLPPPAGPVAIADAGLRELIARCLRPDPAARPTASELGDLLVSALDGGAGPAGALWREPAVAAEIDRRRQEPAVLPNPPARHGRPRRTGRRAVLLGAAAVVAATAGSVAGVVELLGGDGRPRRAGGATPRHAASATPAATPAALPTAQTLEFYAFGTATVKTLTTTVNGESLTVSGVPLPYSRIVRIPRWPARTNWRIDYHCTPGEFRCKVIVNGSEYGSAGDSSNSDDIVDHVEGTI